MENTGNKKVEIITIGGEKISFRELLNTPLEQFKLNSYFVDTLSFIYDWLKGVNEFLIKTSGSTGAPKTITISREQMTASAEATAKALRLQSGYSSLVCLNTNYIAGKMMLVRSLVTEMKMTIVEPSSYPFKDVDEDESFDFAAFVPLQVETLLERLPEKKTAFQQLKCFIIGGAPISSSLNSKLSKISVPAYATYGMTETISHIALQKLNGAEKKDYFEALENVELMTNKEGCLLIKSPATNQKFIQTNDVVQLIDSNKFKFLGRIDNVINSGGIKVFPEKIESILEKIFVELGIVRRFFVFGVPHPRLGAQVNLFIEGDALSSGHEASIIEKLNQAISHFELPKKIKYLSSFKETATGKINRTASLKP